MAIQKEPGKPGSLKYAAAKLGVSLPMVYRLIEAGKLRSYHIGRAHRVSPESIADCIALLERESQGARGRRDFSASALIGRQVSKMTAACQTALTNVAWTNAHVILAREGE